MSEASVGASEGSHTLRRRRWGRRRRHRRRRRRRGRGAAAGGRATTTRGAVVGLQRREGGGGEEARRDDGGAELRRRVGADAARVRPDELGPGGVRAAGCRPGGHRRRPWGTAVVAFERAGVIKGPGLDNPGSPTSKSTRSVTSDDASTIVDALTDLRYGEHMVFLVHGYAGSLQDLRLPEGAPAGGVSQRAHAGLRREPRAHGRRLHRGDGREARGEEVAETMEDLESGALVPRGAGGSPGRPRRRRRRRRRGSEPRRGYPSPRTPSAFSSSARR